jgi:hypothetical protein
MRATGMGRLITVAALALLSSGCATYSWYRPDTPPAVAAQDTAECYDLARDSARDIVLTGFPGFYGPRILGPVGPWPYTGWSAWGDPYWGPAGDPLWRMDVEQRIYSRCMRGRGYDLHRKPNA